MYHSESDIDCLYKGGNPRSGTTLQNRIIEVRDQTSYGSESNLNYDKGRVSEIYISKQTSTNVRVGDQNLYGPGSRVEITYEEGNLRPVAMPMGRNQTVVNPGGSNGNNLPVDFNVESLGSG